MSRKANPTLIGLFTVAAIALAVTAALLLGSGKLFTQTGRFVLYFDESISGLDIGSPVEYGGVRIGSVTDILMEYNADTDKVLIPVYIELERKRLQFTGSGSVQDCASNHIQKNLRAQLQSQSFLTGKLKVMLINAPDAPARRVGGDPHTAELPTIPSLFENIGKSLNELPVMDIMNSLSESSKALADILRSGDIQSTLQELRKTTENLAELTASQDLHITVASLRGALDKSQTLLDHLNRNMEPLQQDISATLKEFSDTARSARYLIDYLDRHPEALIHGKGKEQP
jgi:paraquat-inducible protein B